MAFFWKNEKDLNAYRGFRRNGTGCDSQRTPGDIPSEEHANALEWLVRRAGSLSKDDATRQIAGVFSLDREDTAHCAMLDIGCELLIRQGRVMVDPDGILKAKYP